MKPEEFKKIIRVIVQEELKKQLPALIPQVLSEILSNKSASVITEKSQVTKTPVTKPTMTKPKPQPISEKPREFKKYTNNQLLNQILNETAANPKIIPSEDTYIGYSEQPTMTESNVDLNISDDNEMMDFKMLNESSPISPIQSKTNIVPKTDEQAKVLGKINRDFRGLMKSIDKKKKAGISPMMT